MRRAQAAMEFIMTYGWAILVVLAAIGALAYFGVLNPTNLLPEKCIFPAGTDCIEKASVVADNAGTPAAADDLGSVQVVMKNSLGYDIMLSSDTAKAQLSVVQTAEGADLCTVPWTINAVHAVSSSGTPTDCDASMAPPLTDCLVDNGGSATITMTCPTGDLGTKFAPGKRFKMSPSIVYTSTDSGAVHTVTGDIQGKAASGTVTIK